MAVHRRHDPADDASETMARVDKLERKPGPQQPKVPTNLGSLKDVRVLYKHPTEKPKDGQLFRWHADDSIPTYKGWWEPGAKVDKGYATDSGTGALSISVDLVDGDWDTTRACHVEATMLIDPAFNPVLRPGDFTAAVTIDGDPHDLVFPEVLGLQGWVPSPVATLLLIDADAGPGPPAPSADVEVGIASWMVVEPHSARGSNSGNTVAWTFTGGTPHIEALLTGVNTDAWPESHAIYVIWRLTYL